MELSDRLKKFIKFAMDPAATRNEKMIAALKFFEELGKDYSDAYVLIEVLEAAPTESGEAAAVVEDPAEFFSRHVEQMQQEATRNAFTYDDQPCPFGKHKGKPLREVPTGWLQWACRLPDLYAPTRKMFEAQLRHRGI